MLNILIVNYNRNLLKVKKDGRLLQLELDPIIKRK